MSLRIPYSEFREYMDKRKDSYSVREAGSAVVVTFNGSSPMVVEKLGKPVMVTITAERIGEEIIFKGMRVAVGDENYEASPSSLESWLIEITGRLPL
jgi:hypothetical protein